MTNKRTKIGFRRVLENVAAIRADAEANEVAAEASRLREAFLAMGSETPDNVDCMRRVEVGPIDDGTSAARPCWGLRLAKTGASLSDVMNCAEGTSVPASVAAQYPEVDQEEWDALLRFATMIFAAFEGDPAETT